MPLSDAKKAYRQTESEKEKRRAYAKAYRMRADVKTREAQRARARRAAPGGVELNRCRVKANRAALGRNYITELLTAHADLACRDVPDALVSVKRDQIELRRLAQAMQQAANNAKDQA